MLFYLALLITPAFMFWQLVWTVKNGRLPPVTLLSSVTRQKMPIPFWLYVVGLSFATAVVITLSATILVSALRADR
jgi:hypothetical protein